MRRAFLFVAFSSLASSGCGETGDPGQGVAAQQAPLTVLGDPLPGTDPATFAMASQAFADVKHIEDGLGPTFNESACGSCHTTPVIGGSGEQIERRFGLVLGGIFSGFDADEERQGGTLLQAFSNGTFPNGNAVCTIPVDVEPESANVRDVGRRTQPLFGLGLVDAMPDSFFDFMALVQPSSIRGVVQRVPLVLPDPRDPSQSIGSLRVGRFGWKGLIPSLLTFSADAFDNEMGMTTQSCFQGVSIKEFAVENHPNNAAPPNGCNGGDLAPAQPAGDPDVPEFVDEAVGSCRAGRTAFPPDLVSFTTFVERLAPPPPPRRLVNPVTIVVGGLLFASVGCAGCHVPIPFVTPSAPFNGVPGNYVFFPFSDFLAHDMGTLGDGIGQSGDPVAQTRLMRTQPLWGARFNTSFLHDGRATTVGEAVMFHDGQAAAARAAFERLPANQKKALVEFVLSL